MLETLAAENRATLRRSERNRSFLATARTYSASFHLRWCRRLRHPGCLPPLCLATLATFRLILELLVMEKQLFPCRENEIFTAVNALDNLVLEFHGYCPFQPIRARRNSCCNFEVPAATPLVRPVTSMMTEYKISKYPQMSAKLTVLAYSNFHVLAVKFNHFKTGRYQNCTGFLWPVTRLHPVAYPKAPSRTGSRLP